MKRSFKSTLERSMIYRTKHKKVEKFSYRKLFNFFYLCGFAAFYRLQHNKIGISNSQQNKILGAMAFYIYYTFWRYQDEFSQQ